MSVIQKISEEDNINMNTPATTRLTHYVKIHIFMLSYEITEDLTILI